MPREYADLISGHGQSPVLQSLDLHHHTVGDDIIASRVEKSELRATIRSRHSLISTDDSNN